MQKTGGHIWTGTLIFRAPSAVTPSVCRTDGATQEGSLKDVGLCAYLCRWAGPEEAEMAGEGFRQGNVPPHPLHSTGTQEIGLEETVKVKSGFST